MAQRHPIFQWFSHPDQYQVQISAENMAPRTLIVTKMVFGGHPLALKSTEIRRFHGAEIAVKCTPDFEMSVHATGKLDPVVAFMLPSKEIATSLQEFGRKHGILNQGGYTKEINCGQTFISKATLNAYHLVFH
jgi:hypothetical protein